LDAKEGRAAFYLENSKIAGAQLSPMPLRLPRCAILEKTEGSVPIVIIQAEMPKHSAGSTEACDSWLAIHRFTRFRHSRK
jgi:hypothetical protein